MKGTKKTKTTVIFKEKEWYRKKIIEMVKQINNDKFLKRIFISLRDYIADN